MKNPPPRTHAELDALLARELAPLLERLADECNVVTTVVCVIEGTETLSVCSCMTAPVARDALKAALAAYERQSNEA